MTNFYWTLVVRGPDQKTIVENETFLQLFSTIIKESENLPVTVVASSHDHAIRKLELIEQLINDSDVDHYDLKDEIQNIINEYSE